MERLPLFEPAAVKAWSTAESTVAASTAHTRDAATALHWHITVDYHAGEAKYPIGWPRTYRSLPAGPLRDWSAWDYFHCWVHVATNRAKLPAIPAGLGLHVPDRASSFQRTLSELKTGEWVEIRIPIAQIPRAHDVRQIQFHIAESNYQDGDRLDFYFSDLALLRHAAPTIIAFTAENAVIFADAKRLPMRLQLAGLAADATAEVVCELQTAGRIAARTTLRATRGVQTAALDLAAASLAPGDYELRAQIAGQSQSVTTRVRVVESPWKSRP